MEVFGGEVREGGFRNFWLLILFSARVIALEIGYGKALLSVQIGKPLGGYFGLSDRMAWDILDPPEAIALIISDGFHRVAVISLDVLIIRKELRDSLLLEIQDLKLNQLTLVATHTHSGPGGYVKGWLAERVMGASYNPKMQNKLVAAMKEALIAADKDLEEASVHTLLDEVHLAVNRSDKNGLREKDLPILRFDFFSGKKSVLLFSYGGHPTVLTEKSHAFSADYPGWTRRKLEQKGWRPIFLPGPLGDQRMKSVSTSDDRTKVYFKGAQIAELERLESISDLLSDAVDTAARNSKLQRDPKLSFSTRWVTRPREIKLHPKSDLSKLHLGWAIQSLMSPEVPFQITHIANVTIVALPAEPSCEIGLLIRETVPNAIPMVVAHANDWLGYAVTQKAYVQGKYETSLSFFGPNFGEWVVKNASMLLNNPLIF